MFGFKQDEQPMTRVKVTRPFLHQRIGRDIGEVLEVPADVAQRLIHGGQAIATSEKLTRK